MIDLNQAVLLTFLVNAVAGISFYLVYAAGQFNVTQVAFMMIGGYSAALLTKVQVPWIVALLAALIASAVVAALVTGLTRRLNGVYLAMATLAFVVVVQQIAVITPAFGGASGLFLIPLTINLGTAAIILVIVALVAFLISRSRLGYEMRTTREDAVSARALGIRVPSLRLSTGIISALVACVAGSMLVMSTGYAVPTEFGFPRLINVLAITIVGGTGRWWGPILGAAVLTILPELTRSADQWREVISGVLILAIITLFPDGLSGLVMRLVDWIRKRRPASPLLAGAEAFPAAATAPKAPPVLTSSGVSKSFGGITAVDEVSIEVQPGRVHGLIGPNGAGKSTLVNLLSGELPADAGEIRIEGQVVTRTRSETRARLGLARTFQAMRLPDNMTVRETVFTGSLAGYGVGAWSSVLPFHRKDSAWHRARAAADSVIGLVGLGPLADRRVRALSFGQQRSLEIARALALRPKILLLDEPTAGMNRELLPAITALIRRVADSGVGVVLIEHNIAFIRASVDDLYVLDRGRLIASGTPDEVLALDEVITSYVGRVAAEGDGNGAA